MIAYLDTQLVVRLVQGNYDQITYEIGRLLVGGSELVLKLKSDIGLEICPKLFAEIAAIAMSQKWTRDPFDRIIVAHAKLNGVAPLITSDETIRANYINAVW